jgi:hypothetical protein
MAMKIYLTFAQATPHPTYVSAAKAIYAFYMMQNPSSTSFAGAPVASPAGVVNAGSPRMAVSKKRARPIDTGDRNTWVKELFANLDASYEKRIKALMDKSVKVFVEKCFDERLVRMRRSLEDLGTNLTEKFKKEANIVGTLEGKIGMFLEGLKREQIETMTYFFKHTQCPHCGVPDPCPPPAHKCADGLSGST